MQDIIYIRDELVLEAHPDPDDEVALFSVITWTCFR